MVFKIPLDFQKYNMENMTTYVIATYILSATHIRILRTYKKYKKLHIEKFADIRFVKITNKKRHV